MNLNDFNKDELKVLVETELSKRSLYEFFKLATKILYPSVDWQYPWHFKYVCDLLQAETERIIRKEEKDKDYIFNLPFRSGKSILISVIFPAWVWILDPTLSVISISSSDELSTKFCFNSLMLMESQWFQKHFPEVQIRNDARAKGLYQNTKGGSRQAFGVNSCIIGSGANILILDDVSDPAKVSVLGLRNVINAWQDVIYSRLNNPSIDVRIILQQRVHEGDLSGYLMQSNPDKYNLICIPAKLSKDLSPIHLAINYEDGLFWKERFTEKVIEDFRTTMRPQNFSGQLMQRPMPESGDILKREWFPFIKLSEVLKLNLEWQLVLDTAFTSKQKNDPTGILMVAKHGNIIYIRKAWQKWLQFNDLIEYIKETQKSYNVKKIWVEEKASGISIVQELKRQTNYNVLTLSPKGNDKLSRVIAAQPSIQSGRVILVEDDEWTEVFLSQCAGFPLAVHDDLVDCLAYSCEQFIQSSGGATFRSVGTASNSHVGFK